MIQDKDKSQDLVKLITPLDHNNYFCIFPMSYCNGQLHIGHLYVLNTLYNTYCLANPDKRKLIFPYHVSGLPATIFFEKYTSGDGSAISVVSKFTEKKLSHISQWFTVVKKFNDSQIRRLNYPVDFEHTHFTAYMEPNYDAMVQYIFSDLEKRNLIYEGFYETLFCENCNHSVGDHELEMPITIKNKLVKYHELQGVIYFNEGKTYYSKTHKKYLVCNELFYCSLKHSYQLIDNDINMPYIEEGIKKTVELSLMSEITKCRCGTTCSIQNQYQTFIDYGNVQWKKITAVLIERLNLQPSVKKALLYRLNELKGWPIFRSRGIGTFYKSKIIDPLSDSVLFPMYALIHPLLKNIVTTEAFWHALFTGEFKTIDPRWILIIQEFKRLQGVYRFIEVTGKDLINNHVIFSLFFDALWNFSIDFYATGHILSNGEKMSKSKNNSITVSQLINKYDSTYIKYFLSTCAQGTEDGDITWGKLESKFKEYATLKTNVARLSANKVQSVEPFIVYLKYVTAGYISKLHQFLNGAKFKSFYSEIISYFAEYTPFIDSYTFQELVYLLKLTMLPIDHTIQLTEYTSTYTPIELYDSFNKYRRDLDKDINRWFLNGRRKGLVVYIGCNNMYRDLLAYEPYVLHMERKHPRLSLKFLDSPLEAILFEDIC